MEGSTGGGATPHTGEEEIDAERNSNGGRCSSTTFDRGVGNEG